MEKRVVFRSAWLPFVLVAPQLAITVVFFFWPASQAVWYSFQLQDAFGLRTQFVGLQNFYTLFEDPNYLLSFRTTAVFSIAVAGIGIALSLLLAVMADRVVRGAMAYKTLLIWPYAVAAAVAGVLWLFMFAPSIGIVTYMLRQFGVHWNWVLDGNQAMLLVIMAAAWKQISYNFLFFLAGLQAIPEVADRGGGHRRRRPVAALLDHRLPAALADHLLPAGGQRRLRLLRHLRHHRRHHPGRPRAVHDDPRLQGLHDGFKAAWTSAARRRSR
jgi:hypothetical protein